jgi:hypothetical protein
MSMRMIFAMLATLFFSLSVVERAVAQTAAARSETIEEYRAELERLVNDVRTKGIVPTYDPQSLAIIFDSRRLIELRGQFLQAPKQSLVGQTAMLFLPFVQLYQPSYKDKELKRPKEYFAYIEVQAVVSEIMGIRGWIDRGKSMFHDPDMMKLVMQSLCERPYAEAEFMLGAIESELNAGRSSAEDSAFGVAVLERLRNRKRWYQSDAHISVCKQLDKIVIAPELLARVAEPPNKPLPTPPEPVSDAVQSVIKTLESYKRLKPQKAPEDHFKIGEKQFAATNWAAAEHSYLKVTEAKKISLLGDEERISIAFARLSEIRLIQDKPLEAEKFSRRAIELLDHPSSSAYAALAYGFETLAVSLRRTMREQEADVAEDRVRKLRQLLEK